MSLFSYLNNDTYGSSGLSMQVGLTIQQALAKQTAAAATTASTSGSTTSGTQITVDAKRAAATKEDAGKDAATLAADLRKELDDQYAAAGQKDSADLTVLSGRALATMALNESGTFSNTEIAAAKLELRSRDRQSVLSQMAATPLTAASLTAIQQQMAADRASMSSEEQQLRQSDPSLR